jgi:hypothetical protein
MSPDTENEGRNLELAQARSREGEVRAVLKAHRGSSIPRGQQWKVREALCLQQLEEAQSKLMSMTRPLRPQSPAQGLVPVAKRLERAVRSRLSRLFGRGPQSAQKYSHSRGRS